MKFLHFLVMGGFAAVSSMKFDDIKSLTPREYIQSLGTIDECLQKMEKLLVDCADQFPKFLYKKSLNAFQEGNFRGIIHQLSYQPSPFYRIENGSTLLHFACQLSNQESNVAQSQFKKEVIKALLLLGFDPNVQNNEGKTALHYAIETMSEYYDKDIAVILLHAGACPKILNSEGLSPLYLLLKEKTPYFDSAYMIYLIKLFLQKGADPFIALNDDSLTPYNLVQKIQDESDEKENISLDYEAKQNTYETYQWFLNTCKDILILQEQKT